MSSTANPAMIRRYGDDVKLFRTTGSKVGYLVLIGFAALLPSQLSEYYTSVAVYAGVAAIGAIGLNLLTGFTGQVSLGHAAFIGTGAYVAAYLGREFEGLSIVVWLPVAALAGAAIGALIGPFALRLRGNYLAIITLGLVFIAQYVFESWESVTGGSVGTPVTTDVSVGPIDFANLELFGHQFARDQGYFYLVWILVGVVALLTKNIVRTRAGRALQAVRDRDLAAEAIGVELARYKVLAFVLSSAMAAMAGALYGSFQQYVSPEEFNLFLSIEYIAMIVVGGVGMVFGSVLGALFIAVVPLVIERLSDFQAVEDFLNEFGIGVDSLNLAVFGLLIVLFLVLEPRGLAALWLRIRLYFRAWPFSY